MFDTTITWGDLFSVVLFILGIGVLFYLLLAIANLVGILKNVRRTLDKNKDNIDNTLDKLPEITKNVAKVTDILKEEMESIQKVIGDVGKISNSAKEAVEVFSKDILVKAKSIVDIIDWIKKLFEKEKKNKDKEIVYKYRYTPKENVVEEVIVKDDHKKDNDEKDTHDINNNENTNDDACVSKKEEGEKPQPGENQQGAGI
ncbi:MAG TPA: hypothetical protein VFD00_00370 [Thermoclostridium sp.]|nr:hypothetical protein [Thermoclostridium sp.]